MSRHPMPTLTTVAQAHRRRLTHGSVMITDDREQRARWARSELVDLELFWSRASGIHQGLRPLVDHQANKTERSDT